MTSNTERVAIITGGSGGIGRVCAARLAKDGMAVVVHYARSKERADQTVANIIAAGGRAIAVGGDIVDELQMSAVFDAAEQELGGVDVLVHTAGIMPLSPIARSIAGIQGREGKHCCAWPPRVQHGRSHRCI